MSRKEGVNTRFSSDLRQTNGVWCGTLDKFFHADARSDATNKIKSQEILRKSKIHLVYIVPSTQPLTLFIADPIAPVKDFTDLITHTHPLALSFSLADSVHLFFFLLHVSIPSSQLYLFIIIFIYGR